MKSSKDGTTMPEAKPKPAPKQRSIAVEFKAPLSRFISRMKEREETLSHVGLRDERQRLAYSQAKAARLVGEAVARGVEGEKLVLDLPLECEFTDPVMFEAPNAEGLNMAPGRIMRIPKGDGPHQVLTPFHVQDGGDGTDGSPRNTKITYTTSRPSDDILNPLTEEKAAERDAEKAAKEQRKKEVLAKIEKEGKEHMEKCKVIRQKYGDMDTQDAEFPF